jgi:phage-related protein
MFRLSRRCKHLVRCNKNVTLVRVTERSRIECRFFRTAAGGEPTRLWLQSLPKDVRLQIGSDIAKVQRMWPISRPLVGSLGGGLYEVVTSYNRNEYRMLFCMTGGAMILLHGFQKKTQKTPRSELNLAKQRRKEVEE